MRSRHVLATAVCAQHSSLPGRVPRHRVLKLQEAGAWVKTKNATTSLGALAPGRMSRIVATEVSMTLYSKKQATRFTTYANSNMLRMLCLDTV